MRRFKKILSVLLAAAMIACGLSGCHGAREQNAFQVPEEFDTQKSYEITFWAKSDTNKAQTNIYLKAIEDFEALYPNIDVKLKVYTDYGRIYSDVITNISTGTTPNVCVTYPDHIATYLTSENAVVPLDSLFDDEKYGLGGSQVLFDAPTQEEIIPKFLKECIIEENHYAIPFMRSTEACYVNKTYVEAMGYTLPDTLTWDFIWEVSQAAMAKDENGNYLANGQNVLIPFIYKSTDNMMIQYLRQNGAGYSTATGTIGLFNDTTEELLYSVADAAGAGAFSTFNISSYPGNFFNAGQCLFAVDSTAGASWMGSDSPLRDIDEDRVVDFETVVMTIPQADPEKPQMISQGPSVCVFNKEDPQEVLASWLFAQYLLTNEVQIAYSQTEGYVPVTSKAQDSAEYQEYLSREGEILVKENGDEDNATYYGVKIQAAKLLLDNMDNTFVTAVFNGSASLRNAAGQLIEGAAIAARGGKTVDDAFVSDLYQEVSARYHLDQIESVTGKVELGALPTAAVVLLACIGGSWVLLGGYVLWNAVKKRNKKMS